MYLDEYIAFLLGCMLNAFSIEGKVINKLIFPQNEGLLYLYYKNMLLQR